MKNVPYRQLCPQGGGQQRLSRKEGISEKHWKPREPGAHATLRHRGGSPVSAHLEICLCGGRAPPLGGELPCSQALGMFAHVVAQRFSAVAVSVAESQLVWEVVWRQLPRDAPLSPLPCHQARQLHE